ncbi:cytochrome CYP [Sarotherodon galilaeus]
MRLCYPLLICLVLTMSSSFIISSKHMWTKMILTHHWPTTFCSMEHCQSNISQWTLHGFWPDGGAFCNSSWHFNSSEIEDLLPDMKTSWPDLFDPLSNEFWKYEWKKHGTCAAKAISLNSQHKYFSKALDLYHTLDLDSILKKFSITPSPQYYNFSYIEGVIENFYHVKPKIQCGQSTKNDSFQVLGQIELCFNSSFTLMDCEKQVSMESDPDRGWDYPMNVDKGSGLSMCNPDVPVYYPPVE